MTLPNLPRRREGCAMALPTFIHYCAEKIGKPISAFTKNDWKKVAITAAEFYDAMIKVPRRRGRKPKYRPGRTLSVLLGSAYQLPKRPIGRPVQKYGKEKVSIGAIAKMIDMLLDKEVRKKWPKEAPRSQIAAARSVLKAIGYFPGYAEAVLRSVRDFRKKSSGKF